MNSVPFSFLPSVGDLTPLIVNVSRILVANMGDTDGKDEKHEALPSGSAFRDDASESFCYAAEDDEETQIHLGPKISIKEHLEKDKVIPKLIYYRYHCCLHKLADHLIQTEE
ncbi:unnamed protein product [Lactuca virosa]|uniref:Uncharacterized protein n=1 Tax=Lactuca virosa TaxID=75947 RepID=A0AAU9MKH8_9ASTR|nr:unnamed protein product [Lactuca virosa]